MVGFYPLVRVRREPRRRVDRHAAARVSAVRRTSIICTRTGRSRWRRAPTARQKLEEFNRTVRPAASSGCPGSGPGFELALMLEAAVEDNPGCDGIILGGHGLFTWGDTQRECYLNSIRTIDQMGRVHRRASRSAPAGRCSAAPAHDRVDGRRDVAVAEILPVPARRGVVEPARHRALRRLATTRSTFAEFAWAEDAVPARHELSRSLPAHAHLADVRRRGIRRARHVDALKAAHRERVGAVPRGLRGATTSRSRQPDSPELRDSNPSVVVIPGLGLFGFGKDKREARITTEFFLNAIHVMAGANALEGRRRRAATGPLPQARRAEQATEFNELPQLRRAAALGGVPHRVLGARRSEAAADAAETEFSRKIVAGRRRRQRHRPRSGAAARAARRARRRRRSERRRRPREAARRPPTVVVGRDGAWRRAVDLDVARQRSRRRCAPPCCSSAASTSSSTPRRSIRRRHPATPTEDAVGARRCRST